MAGINAFESLVMLLLSEKLGGLEFNKESEISDQVKRIKEELLNQISTKDYVENSLLSEEEKEN